MTTNEEAREYYRRWQSSREVANLPPPWKRSLIECGMRPRTTRIEAVAVTIALVVLFAAMAGLAVSIAL